MSEQETCRKWSKGVGISGGRCNRPVADGQEMCPRHMAGQRRREETERAYAERAEANRIINERLKAHQTARRGLIEAVKAFLADPTSIYGLIYSLECYSEAARAAGYPDGVYFDADENAATKDTTMPPSFRSFDSGWTRATGRRPASPGGVRETFYRAGYDHGRAGLLHLLAGIDRKLEVARLGLDRNGVQHAKIEQSREMIRDALATAGK